MISLLTPDNLPPNTLLAEDDRGQVLFYDDLPNLEKEWAGQISGRRLVALLSTNTTHSLSAYLGLLSAGHVVLLLSAKIAPSVLADLNQVYGFGAIVRTDQGQTEVELLSPDMSAELHPDLSVCLSTSGSTGSPKLVRFTSPQLVANAQSIAEYLELSAAERPLAHLPIEYSFGLSVLHSHMAVGATLLLTEHSVMQKPFWERFAGASSFSGVPFHFEMLLRMRLARMELPNLRTLTQAGGRLGRKEAETLYTLAKDKGWEFHIMYGQTEAGPRISWLPFDKMDGRFDCIGQAIPGTSLEIAEDGELIVASPAIMMGYAESRTDLSKGDEMLGKLATGDMVEEVDAGIYRVTGRKNRFIKLQGNRVSLSDVESRLADQGHLVCAVGQDDQLVLFSESSQVDDIRKMAVELFSFPARSVEVRQIDAFPRRSNDKIDFTALKQLAFEGE